MFKEHNKAYTGDEYIVRMWEKEYLQDMASRFMYQTLGQRLSAPELVP